MAARGSFAVSSPFIVPMPITGTPVLHRRRMDAPPVLPAPAPGPVALPPAPPSASAAPASSLASWRRVRAKSHPEVPLSPPASILDQPPSG